MSAGLNRDELEVKISEPISEKNPDHYSKFHEDLLFSRYINPHENTTNLIAEENYWKKNISPYSGLGITAGCIAIGLLSLTTIATGGLFLGLCVAGAVFATLAAASFGLAYYNLKHAPSFKLNHKIYEQEKPDSPQSITSRSSTPIQQLTQYEEKLKHDQFHENLFDDPIDQAPQNENETDGPDSGSARAQSPESASPSPQSPQ